jgi:hypothetical protein
MKLKVITITTIEDVYVEGLESLATSKNLSALMCADGHRGVEACKKSDIVVLEGTEYGHPHTTCVVTCC